MNPNYLESQAEIKISPGVINKWRYSRLNALRAIIDSTYKYNLDDSELRSELENLRTLVLWGLVDAPYELAPNYLSELSSHLLNAINVLTKIEDDLVFSYETKFPEKTLQLPHEALKKIEELLSKVKLEIKRALIQKNNAFELRSLDLQLQIESVKLVSRRFQAHMHHEGEDASTLFGQFTNTMLLRQTIWRLSSHTFRTSIKSWICGWYVPHEQVSLLSWIQILLERCSSECIIILFFLRFFGKFCIFRARYSFRNLLILRNRLMTHYYQRVEEYHIKSIENSVNRASSKIQQLLKSGKIQTEAGELMANLASSMKEINIIKNKISLEMSDTEIALAKLKTLTDVIEEDPIIRELQSYLRHKPWDVYKRWELAKRYAFKRAYKDAIKEYNSLLKQQPELYDARMELGDCYIKLEMWDEASTQFEYLKTSPRYFDEAQKKLNEIKHDRLAEIMRMGWRVAPTDTEGTQDGPLR